MALPDKGSRDAPTSTVGIDSNRGAPFDYAPLVRITRDKQGKRQGGGM